jgi:hypothetical protein
MRFSLQCTVKADLIWLVAPLKNPGKSGTCIVTKNVQETNEPGSWTDLRGLTMSRSHGCLASADFKNSG